MEERENYRPFTKPAELHKAINTLQGIVAGISADQVVNDAELSELTHWCQLQAHLQDRHPFSEIIPAIEKTCRDGVITEEEKQDILWLCRHFTGDSSYYDTITSSIQFLSGLVHGLMADGYLSDSEILALKKWIDDNSFLSGTYPFDEINSLLYVILEDHVITEEERGQLSAFLGNVIEFKDSLNLVEQDFVDLRQKYSVSGICSVCPELSFKGKLFCFTGESYRCTRAEIAAMVESLGGTFRANVSKKTDYLIVGNGGNPCWAYSCYGRKIEEAMRLRKSGAHVVIVNETDFWDAVEDAQAGITDEE